MKSDNLKPVDPNDPRLGALILTPEQKAILENCDRIIALEKANEAMRKRVDRLERMAKLERVK